MGKAIDIHYHTKNSDGENTLLESIAAAQRLGLAALVVTDHISACEHWIGPTQSYRKNVEMLRIIRRPLIAGAETSEPRNQYPVIIGMELCLPARVGQGEVLVFGTELCVAIQKHKAEITKYGFEEFKKLKERYECAIVACHPGYYGCIQRHLIPILDGCELTYKGGAREDFEQLKQACEEYRITPLVSSDGHATAKDGASATGRGWLGKAKTIMKIDINNEKDLIRAIKENLIESMIYDKTEKKDFFDTGL